MSIPKLYARYHAGKDHTSIGLFRVLNEEFNIRNVFYPGSHVHITPSLIFQRVTYADSFKNTYKFFEDNETISFITNNKEYTEEAKIRFFQQDYNEPFKGLGKKFDLVISQYAGFVGQAGKTYLKKGGLLVCNNSHGDASMASIDTDYKLVAVYERIADDKFTISKKNLTDYLTPKKGEQPTRQKLIKSMKGVAYTKNPSGYVFKKVTA